MTRETSGNDDIHELDTCGLLCPLPVLKLRKALQSLDSGETIKCIATDPASRKDVQDFCRHHGHILRDQQEITDGEGDTQTVTVIHYVQKGVPR